jgi:hypothetical protein
MSTCLPAMTQWSALVASSWFKRATAVIAIGAALVACKSNATAGAETAPGIDGNHVPSGNEHDPVSTPTGSTSAGGLGGASAGGAAPPEATHDAGAPKPMILPPDVTITVRVLPLNIGARVRHGNKTLGITPRSGVLTIRQRRDSGPLDLTVSARNFLTVYTRADTFASSVMEVKLTPLEEKETLFGFRKPLPPDDAGAPN